jgi:hypothetical protein
VKEIMRYEIKFHEQSEGWKHEYMPDGHCVCIERPQEIGGGYVTIDFKRRIFGTGMTIPRFAAIANLEFKGKDWQRRLIEAAVKHLNDVMK